MLDGAGHDVVPPVLVASAGAVALSADGNLLAVGMLSGDVLVRDLRSGAEDLAHLHTAE